MRLRRRSVLIIVPLVVLQLLQCIPETSQTILLSSALLAMGTGGLLLGPLALGGVVMMMMAANQQRNGGSFLANLGQTPQGSSSTLTSNFLATASPPSPIKTASSRELREQFIHDLIVRRSVRQRRSPKKGQTAGNSPASLPLHPGSIDLDTQYRIMRQVAATDPMGCLPKALCGLSASPPSTQSGLLNDYAYLLKSVFTRDEEIDDLDQEDGNLDDFDSLKTNKGKKKKPVTTKSETSKNKKKNKKKKPSDDEDNSSEEEDDEHQMNDEDYQRVHMREEYDIQSQAQEELIDQAPEYFSYTMRDQMNLGPYEGAPRRPEDHDAPPEEEEYIGVAPSDLKNMSEAELDAMLSRMSSGPSGPPPRRGHPNKKKGSVLSSIMPNLSMGFTPAANKGAGFAEDPFFSGFRRSIDGVKGSEVNEVKRSEGISSGVKGRDPTAEEELLFKELRQRQRQRADFIMKKKLELSEVKDPVEKFRIAAEFGERLKSPRQCRILFNNCPFNYTQVLEMMAGFRKVVLGQPLNPPPAPIPETGRDKEVNLAPIQTGTKNIINLNTGGVAGSTIITHRLPNGEKVEINMNLSKGNGLKRKKSNSTSTSTSLQSSTNTGQETDIFDDDKSLADDTSASNETYSLIAPPKSPPTFSSKPSAMDSLQSLKATMLAIQQINNATLQRKKEGRPISAEAIVSDITSSKTSTSPKVDFRPPVTKTVFDLTSTKLSTGLRPSIKKHPVPLRYKVPSVPSQSPVLLSKSPSKTLSSIELLQQALIKLEDDEVEADLPNGKPGSSNFPPKRRKTPPFPPKNQIINVKPPSKISTPLKSKKKTQNVKTPKDKPKDDEPISEEDEEDDDDEDEEEDEEVPLKVYDDEGIDKYLGFRSSGSILKGSKGNKSPRRDIIPSKSTLNPSSISSSPSSRTRSGKFILQNGKRPQPQEESSKIISRRRPKKLWPQVSVEFVRNQPL